MVTGLEDRRHNFCSSYLGRLCGGLCSLFSYLGRRGELYSFASLFHSFYQSLYSFVSCCSSFTSSCSSYETALIGGAMAAGTRALYGFSSLTTT